MSERRCRIYWLPEGAVWALVSGRRRLPHCLSVYSLDGVPDDVTVDSVFADWPRRAFGFRVSHPSFEVVPDGMPVPETHLIATVESIRLDMDPDGRRARAYDSLLEENTFLRQVLADRLTDEATMNAAYQLGYRAGCVNSKEDAG